MERKCIKCFKSKDMEQFRKLHGDGFSNYCEACRGSARRSMARIKTTEERTEAHKAWRESGSHKATVHQRNSNLKTSTGLTYEEYKKLEDSQNGKCFICEKGIEDTAFTRLHVDHCHKTNKLRKLLCGNCNTAIGLLHDSPVLIQKVLDYVTTDYSESADYRGKNLGLDNWKYKAEKPRM